MAAQYTYLTTDLLTNTPLQELPLNGVGFDRSLNKAGNLQATTYLDNPIVDNDDMIAATEPGRTAVWVYRDDKIVWGGIIWSRWYQSQAKVLQFSAQTFESMAFKRLVRFDSVEVWNDEQCRLIDALWRRLQFDFNSNISVQPIAEANFPADDIVRQLTLEPWSGRTLGQYIEDVLSFDDSPDYTIEVFEESGVPVKQLRCGYPRLGNSSDITALTLDYPGNILNYYWTESASDGATASWAFGDGDGSAIKVGFARNEDKLTSGYPYLDTINSHSGVTVQATIDSHAAKNLADNPMPTVSPTIEIKADEEPIFGTYDIGDDAKVEIIDARFPDPGLQTVVRVVGWSVSPGGSDGVEEVSLVIEGAE